MKRFAKSAVLATAAILGVMTTPGWSQSGAAELEGIDWTVSPPQRPGAPGYQPSASELIAMKATGVTPEYAKKMNARRGTDWSETR